MPCQLKLVLRLANIKLFEPVLQQALGSQWSSLAPVIQAHYGLTPFSDEQIHLKGKMDRVFHSPVVSLLLPLAALAGAMVPYRGSNVPVEVVNYSVLEKPSYFWHRTFFFPGKKPFVFQSSMQCTGEGELTEYVRFGLGIRFSVGVKNSGLVERELGYVWRIGERSIPIPISVMLGQSYVEEMPISDFEYVMQWTIAHPLFGQTFAYSGRFAIVTKPAENKLTSEPPSSRL